MATDIERLTVLMEANTKQFANSIKKIERDVDKAFKGGSRGVRQFDLSLGRAAGAARTLAGAFGVGFLAGGLTQLPSVLKQITTEASKLVDTAAKVNLTTDALQELRFAADQTGVASSQLDIAMQRFSRRLAEAAAGTGVLKDVLRANNVALRDQDGRIRPTVDLLGDYADLIKGAASEQDKLRLAFLAFDTEGAALVNTLRGGRDGLDGLRQSARDASAVIDEDLLKSAKEIDDKFNALTTTIGTKFKSAVLTGLSAATSAMSDFEREAQRVGNSNVWVKLAKVFGADIQPGLVPFPGSSAATFGTPGMRANGGPPPFATTLNTPKATRVPTQEEIEAERKAEQLRLRRIEQIARVTEGLEFEAAQLGRTAQQQELMNSLRAAGTTLDTEAGVKIAMLVGQVQAHEQALANAAVVQQYFGQVAESVFDRLIEGGAELTDVLEDIVKQLALAAAKAALFGGGPFGSLFGGGSLGGGDGIGSLLSGFFGGARAAGGPVDPSKAYLVGENGPELFRPQTPGQIVPNGGGPGETVVIDVRGIDPSKLITGEVFQGFLQVFRTYQRNGGRVLVQ